MSSHSVRTALRDGWSNLIPEVPYYDTNNTAPPPEGLPTVWVTMIFEAQRERITIGSEQSCYRELGTCAVVIMTKAGTNDAQATQLAERISDEFLGFSGVSGHLEVINVQPPNDAINEVPAKSEYYKTLVEMDYRYDHYA